MHYFWWGVYYSSSLHFLIGKMSFFSGCLQDFSLSLVSGSFYIAYLILFYFFSLFGVITIINFGKNSQPVIIKDFPCISYVPFSLYSLSESQWYIHYTFLLCLTAFLCSVFIISSSGSITILLFSVSVWGISLISWFFHQLCWFCRWAHKSLSSCLLQSFHFQHFHLTILFLFLLTQPILYFMLSIFLLKPLTY